MIHVLAAVRHPLSFIRPTRPDSSETVGLERLQTLRSACSTLRARSLSHDELQALDLLLTYVYSQMANTAGQDCAAWRALYTDGNVISALSSLRTGASREHALAAVRCLDIALVLAGAPGRGEFVHELIELVQTTFLDAVFDAYIEEQPRHLSGNLPSVPTFPSAALGIPSIDPPPSLLAFTSSYSTKPFLLCGFASDWPASRRWHSHAYLRESSGPGRVVPIEAGADYRSPDWVPKLESWETFLGALESPGEKVLYLAQHDLLSQFPRLRQDIVLPDYVFTSPDVTPDWYIPPMSEDGLIINAWLGPKGTISPPHTVCPLYLFPLLS
jgi:hypothetical protein